jgi:hypothetical protein
MGGFQNQRKLLEICELEKCDFGKEEGIEEGI